MPAHLDEVVLRRDNDHDAGVDDYLVNDDGDDEKHDDNVEDHLHETMPQILVHSSVQTRKISNIPMSNVVVLEGGSSVIIISINYLNCFHL